LDFLYGEWGDYNFHIPPNYVVVPLNRSSKAA